MSVLGALRAGAVLAVLLGAAGAQAAPAHGYQLDWNVPGEAMAYRSCGCADSCWVAEVRSRREPATPKATLRCDCEKLFFRKGKGAERVVAESCDALNGDGKMTLIPQKMQELLREPGS